MLQRPRERRLRATAAEPAARRSGFTVSGTVAGLDGDGLVVQLNGGNNLAVPNNGSFTFNTQLADDSGVQRRRY